LGNGCRVGPDRLSHKRSILQKGPLQNRRNPIPTPQHRWPVERAFSRLIRLESVLACFPRDSDRQLRSRLDLEEVFLKSDMAGADDVRNYPG